MFCTLTHRSNFPSRPHLRGYCHRPFYPFGAFVSDSPSRRLDVRVPPNGSKLFRRDNVRHEIMCCRFCRFLVSRFSSFLILEACRVSSG